MNKAEIIARVKEAADLYREGRYYEALAAIHPIYGRVKHEKVTKLHDTARKQVIGNLQQLLEERRFRRMVELDQKFLHDVDDPDIRILVEEAATQASAIQEAPLEISVDDLEPALEAEPVTEIMSDSWIQAVTDEDTMSDEREPGKGTYDTSPVEDVPPVEHDAVPEDEQFDEDEEPSGDADINELIQRGVSLYEVGDVENALKTWQHGLHLEPDNVILKEYIANAKRELHLDGEPEDAGVEPDAVPEVHEELNKEELNSIIAIARAGEVDRATSMLDKLIKRVGDTPETEEALAFISNLKQDYGVSTAIARSENLIKEGRAHEAVQILEKQRTSFPDNDKLSEALEFARRRAQEQPGPGEATIELDLDGKDSSDTGQVFVRTVAEPESAKKTRAAKDDQSAARFTPRKLMIPIIVVASLLVLVGVGYFLIPQIKLRQFYNQFRQQKEAAQQPVVTTSPAAEAEETDRKHAQLVSHAKQLYNQRRYLLAYYLFLHANTLKNLSDTDQQFLSAARNEMGQEVNESRVSRQAERAFADGKYDEAIAAYYSLLSNQPENIRYKKRLIESYEQAGVQHAYEGDGTTAQEYFSYAEILDPANPILKRHKEVMSRYISGLISKRQVQEWFYFFR